MFLILGFAFAVATVPLSGGRWWYVDHERVRGGVLLLVSVVGQSTIGALPDGTVARTINVGCYALLVGFVWHNPGLEGIRIFAVGTLSNMLAIAANGGVMPVSPSAWGDSGVTLETDRFINARPIEDAPMGLFGDVFAMPSWLPGATAFSIGDIILVVALTAMVHGVCRSRLVRDRSITRRLAGIDASVAELGQDRERRYGTIV